ncbi:MAG: PAS domain S-box protein [Geminicoccaceae bacterium]
MTGGGIDVLRPADPKSTVSEGPSIPLGLEHALLAAIVENSDDAIASKDLSGIVTSWNHAAERLFGYTAQEIVGRPIAVLAAPGREDEMPLILERIRRGERIDHHDTLRRRKDGSLVEVSLTVSPIRDRRGRIIGASKIARDISAQRRMEEERELRLGELRHRVRNLLGMVGAIVHQTAVKGISAQEYRDILMGRLAALTVAHEAAFQTETGTDLTALIIRLLDPYVHGPSGELLTIEAGPTVNVPRTKVQALAFVLHELATNAVKHGALSMPEGRLRLAWKTEERPGGRYLHLRWREQGGPPVAPPSSHGFGMTFIRFASAGELGGGAELNFAPQGLQAKITVRLN